MLTDGMTVYVEKFQWLKKPPKTTQNKKKKKSKETNKQTKLTKVKPQKIHYVYEVRGLKTDRCY